MHEILGVSVQLSWQPWVGDVQSSTLNTSTEFDQYWQGTNVRDESWIAKQIPLQQAMRGTEGTVYPLEERKQNLSYEKYY